MNTVSVLHVVYLGNMWTQSWINIYDQVEPFAGKASIDVTPVLKAKVCTEKKRLWSDFPRVGECNMLYLSSFFLKNHAMKLFRIFSFW